MPRKVEHLIKGLKSKNQKWERVKEHIKSYSLGQSLDENIKNIADYIYSYSILQIPINREFTIKNISINHLEEKGIIVLIPHPNNENMFYIHLHFSQLVLLGTNNSIFNQFNTKLESIIKNGGAYNCFKNDLEELNFYFEIVLNECYIKLERKEIKFYERFKGWIPSKQLIDSNIWNSTIILQNITYLDVDQNKCDRHSFITIKKENEIKEYNLQYCDREMNVTTMNSSDINEQVNKNSNDSIFLYCSLKSFTDRLLVQDLLLDSNKKLYEKNCMILGNASSKAIIQQFTTLWKETLLPTPTIGLVNYYGYQIYDLLYQTSLPKILDISSCNLSLNQYYKNLLRFAFNTQTDSEINELIQLMKQSFSLNNFHQKVIENSKLNKFAFIIPIRFTTTNDNDENNSKIILLFNQNNAND